MKDTKKKDCMRSIILNRKEVRDNQKNIKIHPCDIQAESI